MSLTSCLLAGFLPLFIAALYLLAKKKLKAVGLAVSGIYLCLAVSCLSGAINNYRARADEESLKALKEDYVYLIGSAQVQGDNNAANDYLRAMYDQFGEDPECTLMSARMRAFENDLTGAAVLYDKLEKEGNSSVLGDADRELITQIKDGFAVSKIEAASAISEMKSIEENGGKIEDYGYTAEQKEKFEKIASGREDPVGKLAEAVKKQVDDNNDERYETLEKALKSAEVIEGEYKKYISTGSYMKIKTAEEYEFLQSVWDKYPGLMAVSALDSAYVKALVMCKESKALADYADRSGSQLALVTLGQMIADGNVRDKDLPENFIQIDTKEIKEVAAQCKEALSNIKKELDGADLKEAQDKVEAVAEKGNNPGLTEVSDRIDPEEARLSDQSELYLGESAIEYAAGNVEKGDEAFNKSVETSGFSDNDKFREAMEDISAVIYDTAEGDNVKDVAENIAAAYDEGVPHNNPDVDPEPEEKEEESSSASWYDQDDSTDNGNNQPKNNEEEEPKTAGEELASQGTTCVSKQKAMINIGKIDADSFPEVSFVLQTAKPLDEKNPGLIINDCDVNITDYKITKNQFDKAKLVAVCDKSGSMEGSEGRLQAAVRSLASSIGKKEMMGIIGFSSGVEFSSGLTDDPSDLESYIEMLIPGGGTDIASGTFAGLSEVSGSKDSLNVVIVMTDGEDYSFGEAEYQRLRDICSDGMTMVYTVGMGSSVHPDYLEKIANAGNGKFVFSFTASELEALYSFIHSQMENSYTVTFTAKNLKRSERTLRVTNPADGSTTEKDYYVDLGEEEEEEDTDVVIDGFSTKRVNIKDPNVDVTVYVRGKNFEKDFNYNVTIRGKSFTGTFKGTYSSDSGFYFTLPGTVPAGEYEAVLTADEASKEDSFEVIIGDPGSVTFGAYTFTASKIEEDLGDPDNDDDDVRTLKGNVTLNNFLTFKGTVILRGNVDKALSITMEETNGSYINFSKQTNGMIQAFFGNSINFYSLGSIKLYRDDAHMGELDDYKVDEQTLTLLRVMCFYTKSPSIALYPHKYNINCGEASFNFPCMDKIFEYGGGETPFKFTAEFNAFFNKNGMHTKGAVELADVNSKFNIGTMGFGLKQFALKWDTDKDDYDLSLMVSTTLIPSFSASDTKETSYGFDLSFKGGNWDALMLRADIPITVCAEPPITLSNFKVGVSGLSDMPKGTGFVRSFFSSTWTLGMDISLAKLSAIVPEVGSIFGDLSLVTFADTTGELSPLNWALSLKSTIKLLGEVDWGKIEIKLGKYKFSDYLLGISETDVYGISMFKSNGPDINLGKLKLKLQTSDMVVLSNMANLYKAQGIIQYDIDVLTGFSGDVNGVAEIALAKVNGKWGFYIIIKGENPESNKQKGVKICVGGWKDAYIQFY